MIEKIVLTGAPGSGKSSVLRYLESHYYEKIIPESAEDVIKLQQAMRNPEPWKSRFFQDWILGLQIQRESLAEKLAGRVFIDRGILDGLAYYQLQDKGLSNSIKWAIENSKGRYKKVFLIELGNNCQKTSVRKEDMGQARILQELQYKNYTNAGYPVERIPYIGIAQRAELILRKMKGGERK